MEVDSEGSKKFKKSFFPFFFGAFLVGLGVGGPMVLNEYVSLALACLGGLLGVYSTSFWKDYRIEIVVTKRDV